jgi:hypothetical protein
MCDSLPASASVPVADVVPHGTERDVWAEFVASHVPVPHDAAEIRYSRTNSACFATAAVHIRSHNSAAALSL